MAEHSALSVHLFRRSGFSFTEKPPLAFLFIAYRPPRSFFACQALQSTHGLPFVTLFRFYQMNRIKSYLIN